MASTTGVNWWEESSLILWGDQILWGDLILWGDGVIEGDLILWGESYADGELLDEAARNGDPLQEPASRSRERSQSTQR